MSEIRPELHLWVAYLEKKEELEEAQDRIAELEATLVKVDRAAYQKGFKAGQEAQAARIAELEEALQKQEAITKEDVKWMMAYHQWCVMNGCPPSSSNLIAAHDALTGEKKDE